MSNKIIVIKYGLEFHWRANQLTVNIHNVNDPDPFTAHTISDPTIESLNDFIELYADDNDLKGYDD